MEAEGGTEFMADNTQDVHALRITDHIQRRAEATRPESSIRYRSYPRTEPPPPFAEDVAAVFGRHVDAIAPRAVADLTTRQVLEILRTDLENLGFEVEKGKRKDDKIGRPVFFGDCGQPTLELEVDAYHPGWKCELEIEARPASIGTAVYRSVVQAMVMVEVETLVIAVPNHQFYEDGAPNTGITYERAIGVAETLYGHGRFRLPYSLVVLGY